MYAVVVVIDVVVVFVVADVVVVASAAFVVLIEKYCSISFNLKTKKTQQQIVKTDVRENTISHTHELQSLGNTE